MLGAVGCWRRSDQARLVRARRQRRVGCPPRKGSPLGCHSRRVHCRRAHDDERAARGFQAFYEERGHLRVPVAFARSRPPTTARRCSSSPGCSSSSRTSCARRSRRRNRVVSVQPCLRAGGKDTDLEDVGRTERHCSFFEMMGNFSFGDYFKDEAVDFAWDLVTGVLGLEPDRLWATVHEGDPVLSLDEDEVAIAAWRRVGIPPERIVRLGKDNFWQAAEAGPAASAPRSSTTEASSYALRRSGLRAGPLRPLHGDLQPRLHGVRPAARQRARARSRPRTSTRAWASSAPRCVLQDVDSVFDTDGFRVIMDWIERGVRRRLPRQRGLAAGAPRARRPRAGGQLPDRRGRRSRRTRDAATSAAASSGARSSRRSRIGLDRLYRLPAVVIEQMGDAYPGSPSRRTRSSASSAQEEERFSETLARGLKVFDELADKPGITGEDASSKTN